MRTTILFILLAAACYGQPSGNSGVRNVTASPSGTCTPQPLQYNTTDGTLWGCDAGTWTAVSGGSSMVYPGAGIPLSTGSAWGTSYTAPTGNLVGTGQANTWSTGLQNFSAATITLPTLTQNLIFTDATYDIGATGATRPRDIFLSRNAAVGGTLNVTGHTTFEGVTSTGATGTGKLVYDGSPVLATPVIAQINDTNGNSYIKSTATASAVDQITITNAATANPATVDIAGTGTDTNINVSITPKGSGSVTTAAIINSTNSILGKTASGGAANAVGVGIAAGRGLFSPGSSNLNVGTGSTDVLSFTLSGTVSGSLLVYGWSASTAPGTTANDTGFSRLAAGSIGAGTGAQGSIAATLQSGVVAADPGCTTTAHVGKWWFDITTTTTVLKACMNVAGTLTWVTK